MELKLQSDDDVSSTCIPSSSTDQALRAGLSRNGVVRSDAESATPFDVTEMIQREIEKRRIREEMVAAEIHRRRELEAEVRRELMIERELAMWRGKGFASLLQPGLRAPLLGHRDGFGFEDRMALMSCAGVGIDDKLSVLGRPGVGIEDTLSGFGRPGVGIEDKLSVLGRPGVAIDDRLSVLGRPGVGIDNRLSLLGRSEVGIEERLALSSRPEFGEANAFDIKSEFGVLRPGNATGIAIKSLPEVNKGRVMLLAKSINSNVAGIKRKAETAAITRDDGTPPVSTSKQSRKEWSCALCQVSVTCERALNDHLQGRKHKAKEAFLRTSNTAHQKTGSSDLLPEKSEKSTGLAVPISSLSPKLGKCPDGNQEVMKNGTDMVQKMQIAEDLNMIDGGFLVDKGQNPVGLKMQNLKFWCQMCRVGTNSEELMAEHQNGKKHMTLLQKNGGAVMAISTLPQDVQKVEEITAAKEGKEDLRDNAEETEETEAIDGKDMLQNMQNTEDLNKKDGMSLVDQEQNPVRLKKQHLRFWCQMCRVGANSEVLMTTHRKGKKHMTLLRKNGGSVIAISTLPEDAQKDKETAAKEGECSVANAEETKETAAKEEKEDSLCNATGKIVEAGGEEDADGERVSRYQYDNEDHSAAQC